MNLPTPPSTYDRLDQSSMRQELTREDKRNVKRGDVLEAFYMLDTATGERRKVVITSGVFVIT